MSQIKLKHSGGNGVIIAAPSSNPAADRTLLLPSNSDSTIDTLNRAGNILAVSYGFRTGHLQTTSTSYVDSGITANITPSSSSNKILIQMNPLMGLRDASGQDVISQVRILRIVGGTDTEIFTERTADFMRYMIGAGNTDYMIAGQFLQHQDSPSTTNQITYKLQVRTGGAGTLSCWAGSGIVLQEVAV